MCILNASARLIGGLPKFAETSAFIQETLCWPYVPHHIKLKILTLVHNFLVGAATSYLQASDHIHLGLFTPWSPETL